MSETVPNLVVAENPTVPPVVYEPKEFDGGEFKGFKYHIPVHNTLDSAKNTYGEATILSLINAQIVSRIRTKVKNDLDLHGKKPHEIKAIAAQTMARTGGMLFTKDEAIAWRPDVRELSSKAMFKKASELFAEGKIEEGKALLLKVQDVLTKEAEDAIAAQNSSESAAA